VSKKLSFKIESKNITIKNPENTNCKPCELESDGACTRPCPRNFLRRDGVSTQPMTHMATDGILHPNDHNPVIG